MLSLRLTALSCVAAYLAGCLSVMAVWSYVKRGETIAAQERAISSKDNALELVTDRATNEQGITDARDDRKRQLEQAVPDARKQPMSAAVRSAIDSLPE